jgi:hypothetical protein
MRRLTTFIALVSLFAIAARTPAAPPRAMPPRAMPLRMLPNRPQPAVPVTPFNTRVNSPFLTPTFAFPNQFSPFFRFAPQQRFLNEFQFNAALFNTRFGFPFTFQNQLFQQRLFLLQQQQFSTFGTLNTFNPFLTSRFNTFAFNPFLGVNQFGAFSPFLNTSFSPFLNTGFVGNPFLNTGFVGTPFVFPSPGTSLGGF